MSESTEQPQPSMELNANDDWVPKIDMIFESDEKAYQFYCLYGKEMGFGVRKHYVKRRSSGTVYSRVFCCYKEGFCRTIKEGKKPRPDARTGCHAQMKVRIMDDGRFRLCEFEPNHNHELVPTVPEPVVESVNDSELVLKASKKNVAKPVRIPLKLGGAVAAMRFVHQRAQERQSNKPIMESGDANDDWVPKVDMEFEDDESSYQFYINYAARIGFSVRKHLVKRRASGIIFSRTYCCHKEGRTRPRGEQQQVRNPKPYDRTGCLAAMTVKITKNGKYRVTEFEPKHNHALVVPTKAHLFKWQWRRGLIPTHSDLMDVVDGQGVTTVFNKAQMNGEEKDCLVPPFCSLDCKNYIPSKRMRSMMAGDVGAIMRYMQEKQAEDPSLYYALQLDQDDQVTNVFWTDAKSKVDFGYLGDVVCLDMTYRASHYSRPFAPFIGVNHHKQAVFFGAALLYNESEESFKWLFETFKAAMSGKQPKVILTDRSEAVSNAIATVWPGVVHRFCVWQMYHNAVKDLDSVFEGSTTFAKDFSRCLFDIEEEEEFTLEWKSLLQKYDLDSNSWLSKLYEDRQKWALAYERQTFCADMKATLVKENLNFKLKECSGLENYLEFFKHYESIVNVHRHAEMQADFQAHQITMKMPPSRMLRQAANAYTPAVFKVFQTEFELSMDCMVYSCGQAGSMCEYKVTVDDHPKEYIVRFDPADGTIICSCEKFEFVGVQCRHVLKVLDIINIKELPPQYIIKRWTKYAKSRIAGGNAQLAVDGDKSSFAKRYRSLCCMLDKIAVRAAETVESHTFIESLSDQLMDQVYKILQTRSPEIPQSS